MGLKRSLLCVSICFFFITKAFATQYAFQVTFTDKVGSPGRSNPPISFLSQRALDRRAAFGIVIDSTDWPVSPPYVDSVLTLTGGKLHETSRWLNLCIVLVSDSAQILALQNKPYISNIKQIAYYATQLHKGIRGNNGPAPGNAIHASVLNKITGSPAYYGNTYTQTVFVHGDYLHDQGFKGQGKLIAVIDAGFLGADTHPGFDSMRMEGRLLDVHNFTLDTDYVYDYDTHGTSTLSTMAGNVPGTFIGSAPMAQYALYVSEDDNSEQPIELVNLLAATERADSLGADIISESLGYNLFDDPTYNFNFATDFDGKTTTAAKAANIATRKGMLFVASAGNEGGDSWNNILTPGDADSALTIGNVDIMEIPASSSGYGPNAVGQIKPDVCDLGQGAAVFTASDYGYENGTSFSTPQIAGWAACLWQTYTFATPGKVHEAINRSADHYNNPTSQLGYGVPNFENAKSLLNIQDTPVTPDGWVIANPNPFSSKLILSVFPQSAGIVNFRIIDVAGRTVNTQAQYFNKGYNVPYIIMLPDMPAGTYFMKAIGTTQQQVLKLEKL